MLNNEIIDDITDNNQNEIINGTNYKERQEILDNLGKFQLESNESDLNEEINEDKPEDSIPDLPENKKARDFLKTAPTKGLHMPLGIEVKVMQCFRCKVYGHRTGDRECPLFEIGNTKLDNERQTREDPMTTYLTEKQIKREQKYARVNQLKQLVEEIRREEKERELKSELKHKKDKKDKSDKKDKKDKHNKDELKEKRNRILLSNETIALSVYHPTQTISTSSILLIVVPLIALISSLAYAYHRKYKIIKLNEKINKTITNERMNTTYTSSDSDSVNSNNKSNNKSTNTTIESVDSNSSSIYDSTIGSITFRIDRSNSYNDSLIANSKNHAKKNKKNKKVINSKDKHVNIYNYLNSPIDNTTHSAIDSISIDVIDNVLDFNSNHSDNSNEYVYNDTFNYHKHTMLSTYNYSIPKHQQSLDNDIDNTTISV